MVDIWALIGIFVVFAILCGFGIYFDSYEGGNKVSAVIGGLFFGIVFAVVSFFPVIHFVSEMNQKPTLIREYNLFALTNNVENHSSYFLGTGGSSERPVYYFVKEMSDGGRSLDSTYVSGVTLYDTEDTPRYEVWLDCSDKTYFVKCSSDIWGEKFYVPEGTVWQGYDIDIRRN